MTGLRALNATEFRRVADLDEYYAGRWVYMEHAAALIDSLAPKSVLEVGCGRCPLVPGSITMDLDHGLRPRVVHDARETPWPFDADAVDVVVALQVWEHFGSRHREAFSEALRVAARGVVLSFPIEWVDDPQHNVTRADVARWTLELPPDEEILVRRPGPRRRRLVCLWRTS